jgi:hypothetical protein
LFIHRSARRFVDLIGDSLCFVSLRRRAKRVLSGAQLSRRQNIWQEKS